MPKRLTLKWLPETWEWRVSVIDDSGVWATKSYYTGAEYRTRQSKAEAWWDAMGTAYDMAKRLNIELPEGWGLQPA